MLIKFAKALNWLLGFLVCEHVVYENKKGTYYVTSIHSLFGLPVGQDTKKVKDLVVHRPRNKA